MSEQAELPDLKLYQVEFGKISIPMFFVASSFDEALSDAKAFELNGIQITGIGEATGKININFDREIKRINSAIGKG